MNGEMVTKKGDPCLSRNVRSSIMVLLRSDLKCTSVDELDLDSKLSKLHGTTTFTLLSNFAFFKAA
ncbi:hypothetical protein A2U01_0032741 [Trifolium medium]|uniref:Uncharacterized protein n=1 Tax=Trifolium medium TaxID=97028 RepID=A0A392PJH3_9FABA|nr:hypothetical protein [Trifolium medium]